MKRRSTTEDNHAPADWRGIISAIENLAGDMEKVGPKVKKAERGFVEGLSRQLSP